MTMNVRLPNGKQSEASQLLGQGLLFLFSVTSIARCNVRKFQSASDSALCQAVYTSSLNVRLVARNIPVRQLLGSTCSHVPRCLEPAAYGENRCTRGPSRTASGLSASFRREAFGPASGGEHSARFLPLRVRCASGNFWRFSSRLEWWAASTPAAAFQRFHKSRWRTGNDN